MYKLPLSVLWLIILISHSLFAGGKNETAIRAESGVLDLTSLELDDHNPVKLDGDWEFRWNELLVPKDPAWNNNETNQKNGFYPVPLFWTSYKGLNLPKRGFGTYRLIIETSGENPCYSVKLPELFSEYRLWINGTLIDQRWDDNKSQGPFLKPSLFTFYSTEKSQELVLQIRNRSHSNAGIGQSILFGSQDKVFRKYLSDISLEIILIAVSFFAGLYHIIIYLFRKSERETLYFGLFCLILAVRTLTTGMTLATQIFPDLPFPIGSRIATTVIPLAVIAFLLFGYYFFKELASKKIVLGLLSLQSIYVILVLTVSPMVYSTLYSYYLLTILLTAIYIIGINIYAIFKHQHFSWLFFAGFLILFAGITNDMLHYLQILITGYYLSVFFAGFILSESLMLSIKFSEEHKMVSELSIKLEKAVHTAVKNEELANIDHLSGIYNRRSIVEEGTRNFNLSKRFNHSFSVIMMDIDHFKQINDGFGHETGDEAIKILAEILKSNIRNTDIPGRFGGDEFTLILPGTGIAKAAVVAEKIRETVEKALLKTVKDKEIQFTISAGVASFRPESLSFDEIINQADKMLYESKRKGRNVISYWE